MRGDEVRWVGARVGAVGRRGKVGFGTCASIGSAEERGCGREKKRSDAWGPHGRERGEEGECDRRGRAGLPKREGAGKGRGWKGKLSERVSFIFFPFSFDFLI